MCPAVAKCTYKGFAVCDLLESQQNCQSQREKVGMGYTNQKIDSNYELVNYERNTNENERIMNKKGTLIDGQYLQPSDWTERIVM